jgi:hypothetical protein
MRKYFIPEAYIKGFSQLSELGDLDVQGLVQLFKNFHVGERIEDILKYGDTIDFTADKLELESILRSVLSITSIFETASRNIEEFTIAFAQSFQNIVKCDDIKRDAFAGKLALLLAHFDKVMLNAKAGEIILENKHNLQHSRIISDIRTIFVENLTEDKHYAVIIHNLKLTYTSDAKSDNEFFISLDLTDLHNLKNIVDRAIEKDKILRNNGHSLEFLDIK